MFQSSRNSSLMFTMFFRVKYYVENICLLRFELNTFPHTYLRADSGSTIFFNIVDDQEQYCPHIILFSTTWMEYLYLCRSNPYSKTRSICYV